MLVLFYKLSFGAKFYNISPNILKFGNHLGHLSMCKYVKCESCKIGKRSFHLPRDLSGRETTGTILNGFMSIFFIMKNISLEVVFLLKDAKTFEFSIAKPNFASIYLI